MKYFIISDIHGSSYYLEQALKLYNNSFDKIIILGDVLYHGPRNDLPKDYAPKKVIPVLNGLKDYIICIKGNCDAEVDQMVLSFEIQNSLDIILNGKKVHMEHGHHLDFDNISSYNCSIIMYGHYHVPRLENVQGTILLNPGSVSIPKSEEGHTFAVMDEEKISILNLEGKTVREMNFTEDL